MKVKVRVQVLFLSIINYYAGEEEDEYENTLGDLGADGTEHIDRNMWAPEEKQENDEVRLQCCFIIRLWPIMNHYSYQLSAAAVRGARWRKFRV